MKIRSYNILFRLFSYLADKTNGTPFFVKYKLILGTLIIGVSGVSCNKPQQIGKQKDNMPTDSGLVQTGRKKVRHSSKQEGVPAPPTIRAVIPDHIEEYFITCYEPATIIEDTVPLMSPENEIKEPQK